MICPRWCVHYWIKKVDALLLVRSCVFNIGFVLLTVVYAIFCLFLIPVPYKYRYRIIIQWNACILWWLRVTCGIQHELQGVEHIPDHPCIILSKHQSTWETIAFAVLFPPQAYVLKRELLWLPFFGWGLALTEPIAINRGSGVKAMQRILEQGKRRLNLGRWIVIFPEGTRIAPGAKGRYGIGGPKLAEYSGFPVLPVAHNAGELWPRRAFIKKPGVVRVVIGPLIDSRGKSATEIRQRAEDWIEKTMLEITTAQTKPH